MRFVCMKLFAIVISLILLWANISDRNRRVRRHVLFSNDHSCSLVTLVLHGSPPLYLYCVCVTSQYYDSHCITFFFSFPINLCSVLCCPWGSSGLYCIVSFTITSGSVYFFLSFFDFFVLFCFSLLSLTFVIPFPFQIVTILSDANL